MPNQLLAEGKGNAEILDYVSHYGETLFTDNFALNKKLGDFGAARLLKGAGKDKISVLTHCNTGALATGGTIFPFFYTIQSCCFLIYIFKDTELHWALLDPCGLKEN